MELSRQTVEAIAELAKLQLSEDELTLYAQQLSHILQYFEHLETVDTSHIEPSASVLSLRTVMRPDVAGDALDTRDVLANAPSSQDGQFRVSAVLPE